MSLQNRFKIKQRWIGGEKDACFIIADAGSNHNRSLEIAKKLIDVAIWAGVDAVKFQTYSAETLYPKNKKPLIQIGEKEKPFDIIKKIELPREWQKELADYSNKRGLIFLSTPFDEEAIDQLDKLVPAFKWASPELIDMPLLVYAAKKKKPLIVSTAFYGLNEIKQALKWIKGAGNERVALLHCTGLYPTNFEEANLLAMKTMKKIFKVPIGFSDHTLSTVVPAAAVAMGAKIIEKHFTLDRALQGPDHKSALEPGELKEMVKNIRDIEKSMGSGEKKPQEREAQKEKIIRRGVVSKKEIAKGEKFSLGNIVTKRTGGGFIKPADFGRLLGKIAKKDIGADQSITKEDII